MPAFYAHDRFGKAVYEQLDGELKETIKKHYRQFRIGLQGPDLLFFYRPYKPNKVAKLGVHLHDVSAVSFFEKGAKVIREKGRSSREYAYLLGVVCHFALDSECHPYVESYIGKSGVQHLEIEEEFEKELLRKDGQDPLAYPISRLVPVDEATAEAIYPFYEQMTAKIIYQCLKDLRLVKKILTAPGPVKQGVINTALKISGKYAAMKGLMNQRKDNPDCRESSEELDRRCQTSVPVAVKLMKNLDQYIAGDGELDSRFDRTFS